MEKNKDKITYMAQTTTVNVDTGEVKKYEETTHIKVSSEPNYIKLYIKTLLLFKDLPHTLNPILIEFLNYMSYANIEENHGGQLIYVNIDMKNNIAKKLKLSLDSINKCLFKLEKAKIFKRVGKGTYQVNPNMFGKGEWKDIKAIRATFDYNSGDVQAELSTDEIESEDENE